VEYLGNKWWFCPEIHFSSNAAKCDGEIEPVTIGSVSYSVCVSNSRKKREPRYGAFYSESTCSSSCNSKADCVPTYRHLSLLDPYSMSSSYKDVEIGCVDDPTNTSCTDALCLEKFDLDEMPYREVIWTNDDKEISTVSSGVLSSDTPRPRIDVAGGLSANGDQEARALSSIKEMSEISFANMLKEGSYDVSINTIENEIPSKSSIGKVGNSLLWNLKPNSFAIGDGKEYKFYALFNVSTIFIPDTPFLANLDGVVMQKMDRSVVLKTEFGYKIIYRQKNISSQFVDDNGTSSWTSTPSISSESFETFNGTDFLTFDENSAAENFSSHPFSLDKAYETFSLYTSLSEIVDTQGVRFIDQISSGNGTLFTRLYSGVEIPEKASFYNSVTIYGVYSDVDLSYKELLDMTTKDTTNKNAIYSTLFKMPSGAVLPDGAYNNSKVNMYIGGEPSKMNVIVNFSPDNKEEGKKTFIYMLLYDTNSSEGGI